MSQLINIALENLTFIIERLNWFSLLDLFLVTAVFFFFFFLLKNKKAIVFLRGALLLIVLVSLLTNLEVLPAFSWLVRNTLPAMLFAIPVIFAPEIRRTLERLGRAGASLPSGLSASATIETTIKAVVNSASRLSDRKHGALIVMQRLDGLDDYIQTGVPLNARVSPELLLQIFYPNTPLHDGAVIIANPKIVAAACVMPLSASGVLTRSPERQMGLRHRAALGISEVTDAVTVVVSEETGYISIVHGGRMIRGLDAERLENILNAFYRPFEEKKGLWGLVLRVFQKNPASSEEEE
jgi:diadenylate cyclase